MKRHCPVCHKELDGAMIMRLDSPLQLVWQQCSQCGAWRRITDVPGLKIESRSLQGRAYWQFQLIMLLKRRIQIHTVFDVGCGDGTLLWKLRAVGIDATGIDLDPKLAEQAWALEGDFLEWEPNGAQYDLVTAFDVIEHVESPLKFVSKVHKITPYFLLTTPDASFLQTFLHSPEHVVLFTSASLRRLLLSAYEWVIMWRYVMDPRWNPIAAKYGDAAILLALAGDGHPVDFTGPERLGPPTGPWFSRVFSIKSFQAMKEEECSE